MGEQSRWRLIRCCLSCHDIRCNRPRSSAKSYQRRLIIKQSFDLSHRFIDRRQNISISYLPHPRKPIRITQGVELRPFTSQEFNLPAKRQRHNKNIGKQDGSIEAKSPDWLQCHFRSPYRVEAKIEKPSRLFASRTILRQIPSRLAHQPYRWNRFAFAFQHLQELFPHGTTSPVFIH